MVLLIKLHKVIDVHVGSRVKEQARDTLRTNWSNDGATPANGSESDSQLLGGAFMSADLHWRATENWTLKAGLQFEYLRSYEEQFGDNTVSLDFNHSLYGSLGVSRGF